MKKQNKCVKNNMGDCEEQADEEQVLNELDPEIEECDMKSMGRTDKLGNQPKNAKSKAINSMPGTADDGITSKVGRRKIKNTSGKANNSTPGKAEDGLTTDMGEVLGRKQKNTGGVIEPISGTNRMKKIADSIEPSESLQQIFDNYAREMEEICLEDFREVTGLEIAEDQFIDLLDRNSEFVFIEGEDDLGKYWKPEQPDEELVSAIDDEPDWASLINTRPDEEPDEELDTEESDAEELDADDMYSEFDPSDPSDETFQDESFDDEEPSLEDLDEGKCRCGGQLDAIGCPHCGLLLEMSNRQTKRRSFNEDANSSYREALRNKRRASPEEESEIMNDPESAFLYARDVLRGRWYEAEPTIRNDPHWWMLYCRDVRNIYESVTTAQIGVGVAKNPVANRSMYGSASSNCCKDLNSTNGDPTDGITTQLRSGDLGQNSAMKNTIKGGVSVFKENIEKISSAAKQIMAEAAKGLKSGQYQVKLIAGYGNKLYEYQQPVDALIAAEELSQIIGHKKVVLEAVFTKQGKEIATQRISLPKIARRDPLIHGSNIIFNNGDVARRFAQALANEGYVCKMGSHNWGYGVTGQFNWNTACKTYKSICEGWGTQQRTPEQEAGLDDEQNFQWMTPVDAGLEDDNYEVGTEDDNLGEFVLDNEDEIEDEDEYDPAYNSEAPGVYDVEGNVCPECGDMEPPAEDANGGWACPNCGESRPGSNEVDFGAYEDEELADVDELDEFGRSKFGNDD